MRPTRIERMKRHMHPRSVTVTRSPRPCPSCGRIGECADCCCSGRDHRSTRRSHCSLCGHRVTETRSG